MALLSHTISLSFLSRNFPLTEVFNYLRVWETSVNVRKLLLETFFCNILKFEVKTTYHLTVQKIDNKRPDVFEVHAQVFTCYDRSKGRDPCTESNGSSLHTCSDLACNLTTHMPIHACGIKVR